MIVRILTEGQYRLDSGVLDQLNALDNKLVDAVASNDETKYRELFGSMIELVRGKGNPVPPDELHGSDVILPAPDTSLDEARRLFTGEGVIPG